MTTQVNLHALAERIEKATGAESSRALLRDALLPAFGLNQLWREDNSESDNRDAHFGDYLCDLWDAGGKLDAAVALCERALPGYRKAVEQCVHSEAGWKAWVQILWGPESNRRWEAQAPTPALALCLAIVRAKLAEQAND